MTPYEHFQSQTALPTDRRKRLGVNRWRTYLHARSIGDTHQQARARVQLVIDTAATLAANVRGRN